MRAFCELQAPIMCWTLCGELYNHLIICHALVVLRTIHVADIHATFNDTFVNKLQLTTCLLVRGAYWVLMTEISLSWCLSSIIIPIQKKWSNITLTLTALKKRRHSNSENWWSDLFGHFQLQTGAYLPSSNLFSLFTNNLRMVVSGDVKLFSWCLLILLKCSNPSVPQIRILELMGYKIVQLCLIDSLLIH